MTIHDVKPAPGSRKAKKRVGCGIGGKGGKTAGPGTKGQGARGTVPAGFEGGQTPLQRSSPKLKGFNNPFRVEYSPRSTSTSSTAFDAGAEVTPGHAARRRASSPSGAWSRSSARGELTKPLTVRAHGFSAAAVRAIEAAGGTTDGPAAARGATGRPPARGNALTNR